MLKQFLILILLLSMSSKLYSQCVPNDHFWCGWQEAQTLRRDSVCYVPEGLAFSVHNGPGPSLITLYRFYKLSNGFHFYSTSKEEGISAGYELEGPSGFVGENAQTKGCIPIFRFYHPTTGNHFYSSDEKGELAIQGGYTFEGVGFYAWRVGQADGPMIRFYSPSSKKTKRATNIDAVWTQIQNVVFPKEKVSSQNAMVFISTKSEIRNSCGCGTGGALLPSGEKTYLFNTTTKAHKVSVIVTNNYTNGTRRSTHTIEGGGEIYLGCSRDFADCSLLYYSFSIIN